MLQYPDEDHHGFKKKSNQYWWAPCLMCAGDFIVYMIIFGLIAFGVIAFLYALSASITSMEQLGAVLH
jgi:hypothetical protein